ncbi:CHT4 [Candida oxycetoniae]|uniref:chitinase n=1 Tax=Candida oxycetoniae TaxID=497107 RepID=A0AAI9SWI4_9ASCO|nr:CHT4 [Candida oxycetoniae]KAI3404413.2 CHT4 [Candida oxycetoniae]
MMEKVQQILRQKQGGVDTSSQGFKLCVYFANWSVYGKKHFPSHIPYEYYTHIFYAFLKINSETGELCFTDEWCDLQMQEESLIPGEIVHGNLESLYQMKRLNRSLKVIMSVGGWGACSQFEAITDDKEKLRCFVESAATLLLKYKFDGIDIDWEYPNNDQQARGLVEILAKLRQALPKQTILTVAVPGGEENGRYLKIKEMDQYLSFWNLMTYDFAGQSWSQKTGFHSNLFGKNGDNELCASQVVQSYLQRGVPACKLVLGMPMYGRVFCGVSNCLIGQPFAKTSKEDIINYNKICEFKEHGFDPRKVAAFSYDPEKKEFVTYDNAQSAKIKASYVKSNGLGGGMWWESSGDREISKRGTCESLVFNFAEQLGGRSALDNSKNKLD